MRGKNLTPLLVRVRDTGLTLRVAVGDLIVWPEARLTPALRAELVKHKPALVELLVWSETEAHKLIKDTLAYLAEFYLEAGSPECELSAMHAPEDRIDEAFVAEDMFALRIAVREWGTAALDALRTGAFEEVRREAS